MCNQLTWWTDNDSLTNAGDPGKVTSLVALLVDNAHHDNMLWRGKRSMSNWRNNLQYFYMPVLQVFLSGILVNDFKDQMRQSLSIYFYHHNIINSSIKIRYFKKMTYIFSTHLFNTEYVKQHTADDLPSPLATHRTLHYFQHALGAIDGSHIPIKALAQYQDASCNRKGFVSQNCLFVCSFDFFFTYALAGWEGSASDARVYHEAVGAAEDPLVIPPVSYVSACWWWLFTLEGNFDSLLQHMLSSGRMG